MDYHTKLVMICVGGILMLTAFRRYGFLDSPMAISSPLKNKIKIFFSRALRAYIYFGIGGLFSCLVLNIVSAMKAGTSTNNIMDAIIHKNAQIPESWNYPFAAWVAIIAIISIIIAFRPAKNVQ